MSNRENAYTEVYTILKDLNEEEYNKIPSEVLEAIEENRNEDYEFKLDEELKLKDQELLPETKAILFNLFRDYLSTSEQKEKILEMQKEERLKNELKKKEKFDSQIFSDNREAIEQQIENSYFREIANYKENIFIKLIRFIKNKLSRKRE